MNKLIQISKKKGKFNLSDQNYTLFIFIFILDYHQVFNN